MLRVLVYRIRGKSRWWGIVARIWWRRRWVRRGRGRRRKWWVNIRFSSSLLYLLINYWHDRLSIRLKTWSRNGRIVCCVCSCFFWNLHFITASVSATAAAAAVGMIAHVNMVLVVVVVVVVVVVTAGSDGAWGGSGCVFVHVVVSVRMVARILFTYLSWIISMSVFCRSLPGRRWYLYCYCTMVGFRIYLMIVWISP